ncbi:MAG TPA: zinc-binding alcohol dehydrogenase [Chloroflexota bacterium]|nr:zinc-binding alcohol dehydrogenase [Chloroflexota bacterium]
MVPRTGLSVWFAHARQVDLRSETVPDVGPDDVRVEALASAISHGSEMLVFRGQVPDGLELDLPALRGTFAFPIKYGYANVGRVVETGSEVRCLSQGDAVFVHHPHQSTYVVPAQMPVRLPDGLDPVLGVFLANLETATNVVIDAAPRLGERVAVFGQGVVGLLITQLLRLTGVSQIIAVEPVAHRRELACQVGADVALDPTDGGVAAALRNLTGGAGVDLVIEASGSAAALDQALDALVFGGTCVVCSWYGTKPVELRLGGAFHRQRLRIVSSQVSTIDAALQPRWTHQRRLALARDLLPGLELAGLISHRIPLARAADAFGLVDQHADQTVQVVLTYP